MMNSKNCYQVIVKNDRGQIVKQWRTSLFGKLTIRTNEGQLIIEKRNLLGTTQTYSPAMNESVETRSWWWRITQSLSNFW